MFAPEGRVKRAWIRSFAIAAILGIVAFGDCHAGQHVLSQVSTIDALMTGVYSGEYDLGRLRQKGDFGIGTFNNLNGEMVLLDGRFYRIKETGRVEEPGPTEKTPFAVVTFFEPDATFPLRSGLDLRKFTIDTDRLLPTANIFYGVKITGLFTKIKTRSVPAQTAPYRPLEEVVKTQRTFELKDVPGTIVGFRCPAYAKGINVPGYHLHFITADHDAGGHVLDFVVKEAVLEIDYIDQFFLILPSDAGFYRADLAPDRERALKAIEK